EYAGGYTDMVAQRGAGVDARDMKVAERERSAAVASAPKALSKRKLTFKDKFALESLPSRIAELSEELLKLEAKLADADLFAREPKVFEKTMKRHEAALIEKTAAEEQWLELELMREELEA
ncbi:MAG: hypothetical protein WB821_08485, partial [Burkholderiaceae bacterium]